jgi:hypothetical protein
MAPSAAPGNKRLQVLRTLPGSRLEWTGTVLLIAERAAART